ncbi:Crp/Fnr family transcriptional regulator [Loktanella sp. SALINAS62]|uniref:Crp/Fnr family transcriptional regulator n=1 Tax=Loktanella sp. SALINAS62 TaxID=2706124 RepID=UPI001B8CA0D6|nr:Crp/Fnr family transcriptional regulator [Loktanella sp. SALINAS62]MBS1301209.1 Crp/Fnr family transcriptional regulator [Loktanella sp. SALINAS62]
MTPQQDHEQRDDPAPTSVQPDLIDRQGLSDADRRGMVRQLDRDLWQKLRAACIGTRTIAAREIFSRTGQDMDHSALLLQGILARYVGSAGDTKSQRLMVSMQVPGDFVDLHGLPLGYLDHDIATLTEATVALFPHQVLKEIISESPQEGRALWRLTMIDAAIHRHWIYRSGRLRAVAAMADFICEMDMRMHACTADPADSISLPMTQADLSDVTGISTVHVSRVVKELRESGLCTIRDGRVKLHDRDGLRQLAGFDPTYLYHTCGETDGATKPAMDGHDPDARIVR